MSSSSLLPTEEIGIFMLVAVTLRKYWIAMDSFRNEKENDKKNRISLDIENFSTRCILSLYYYFWPLP